MQRSVEYSMHFWTKIALVVTMVLVVISMQGPSYADNPCRLNEARQIACAAANKSYEIDHSWPRAQDIFATNMTHLSCVEPRKWDGVCKQ